MPVCSSLAHRVRARALRWRRVRCLVPLFVLACVSPGVARHLSRTCYWEPCTPDGASIGIFHLDEMAEPAHTDLEDLLTSTPADPLAADAPRAAGAGRVTANACPLGAPAALREGAAPVAEGRFGGSARLDGRAWLLVPAPSDTGSKSVEAWFRQGAPSGPETTLFAWPDTPVALRIAPDGRLRLEGLGPALQTAPEARVPTGGWWHVALAVSRDWPRANTASVLLNGQTVGQWSVDAAQVESLVRTGTEIAVGHGLVGWVDEIRTTKSVPLFHPWLAGWPQPDRQVEPLVGQPFLRSDDLLLHLPFDGTTQPARAPEGLRHQPLRLDPSDLEVAPRTVATTWPTAVAGRALVLGRSQPVYAAEGLVDPARGTIACWLRPLDWDNGTRSSRISGPPPLSFGLFQIDGLYAPGSYKRNFTPAGPLLEFNLELRPDDGAQAPVPFNPGRWTHLAITWENTDFAYYVDGRRTDPDGAWHLWLPIYPNEDPGRHAARPEWWTGTQPQAIRFGFRTYWDQLKQPSPRTAIDDFRVYRRVLAPSELANLAALYDPRRTLQPLPAAELDLDWNGVTGRIGVKLTPLLAGHAGVTAVEMRLAASDAPTPLAVARLAVDAAAGRASGVVTSPPLEFASYQVRADLLDRAGATLGSVTTNFTRQAPAWWGSRAGITNRVPRPWTPVTTAADTVAVWGRTFRWSGSGFPVQIDAAGDALLAAPIVLELDGTPLAGGTCTVQPVDETRAEVRAESASRGIRARVVASVAYDGLTWFDLTLEPEQAGTAPTLTSAVLRVPLGAAHAAYLHWWSGERDFRNPRVVSIGPVPAGTGTVFRSNDAQTVQRPARHRGSFIPYVMLAGDRRGLAWFAENDAGWTPDTNTPAVVVSRRAGTVELALNLVSRPVRLDQPRTFSFGLHPIPVRPLRAGWRRRPGGLGDVIPDTFSGNNLKGPSGPTAFHLLPEDDWEAVRRRIDGEGLGKGAAGLKGRAASVRASARARLGREPESWELAVPGLYWDLQWNSGFPADTREWTETWHRDYVSYTPEFVDFASWAWNAWLTQTRGFVQGAYLDDCWNRPQSLAGLPHTYALEDGHVQPGYECRGYRARLERMYRISLDHGIEPHLTAHTTHTCFIPYHSFFSAILDGEDFYSEPPAQSDFIDHWSPARLQFMNPAKWGIPVVWLGWCGNSVKTDRWPAWTFRQQRAYAANLGLHDIVWAFDDRELADFGLFDDDVRFRGYWQPDALVRRSSHPETVHVSAWQRAGRWLVLVVNRGDTRVEARLTLDLPPTVRLRDADPTLLSYFADDLTTLAPPDAEKSEPAGARDPLLGGFALDERPEELPAAERRARDPDRLFEWRDGVLACPVRRHDYRLFRGDEALVIGH